MAGRWWRAKAVFGAISWTLAMAAPACSSDEPAVRALGDGCYVPTDCSDPLVCAFQRCHQQCLADRDCSAGQNCAGASAPKKGVCLFAEESACARNSDCAGTLVCSNRHRCEVQCVEQRDCLEAQICDHGSCADKSAIPETGTPTGAKQGELCVLNSDCDAPLVCIGQHCTEECRQDRDCRDGESCQDHTCRRAGSDAGGDGGSSDTGDGGDGGSGDTGSGDATVDATPADAPPGYGKSCVYRSDCPAPLICRASGLCAYECNADVDCASSQTCAFHLCAVRSDAGADAGDAVTDGDVGTAKSCTIEFDCDDKSWCNGPERCISGKCAASLGGPCEGPSACTTASCNETTRTCDGAATIDDVDGDGHKAIGCGGDDCNDRNGTVYGGAPELCDSLDNDCDGAIDDFAVAPRGALVSVPVSDEHSIAASTLGGKWWVVTSDVFSSTTAAVRSFTIDATGTASPTKELWKPTGGQLAIEAAASKGDVGLVMSVAGVGLPGFPFVETHYATLVKSDLTPIVTTTLATLSSTSTFFVGGDVVWDGTAFFAAWHRERYGQFGFIAPDGVLSGVQYFPEPAADFVGGARIKVAVSSGVHAIAFQHYITGASSREISVSLVSSSGGTIASAVDLSGGDAELHGIFAEPGGFAIVWGLAPTLTHVSLTGVKGTSVDLKAPLVASPASASASDGSMGAFLAMTASVPRLMRSPNGAPPFESSYPFSIPPAVTDSLAIASLPGSQLGLFVLSGYSNVLFRRMGCLP